MFFSILFSFFQICFIPGFIIYSLAFRKAVKSNLLMPVFSFGLSLITNYIIVFSLAYFHIYTRSSLIILLIFELASVVAIFIIRAIKKESFNISGSFSEFRGDIGLLFRSQKSFYNNLKYIVMILSCLLMVFLLIVLFTDTGKIFNSTDAIFSWNRWATDFFNNTMPSGTYHYPPLIPANWSIAYVLCGYPFQFINRTIMHFFLILMVYSFIVLGIKQKSLFFFISALLIYQGLGTSGFYWTDGFVDVAVSYFAVMVFISLVSLKIEDQDSDKQKIIFLSILFVLGAAVTKQAGLFPVIIYPLLLYFILENKFTWTTAKILKISLFYICMLAVIVLPYYFWSMMEIKNGNSRSEVSYVTHEIFNGASLSQRFLRACSIFTGLFSGKIIFFLALIFFMVSFSDRTIRFLNLSFVIPYYVLWALFFSYSIRNFAIAVPFYVLGISKGIDLVLRKFDTETGISQYFKNKSLAKSYKWILVILIAILSAGFFILNKKISKEKLVASQDFRLKQLGDAEVNQQLYLYYSQKGIEKYIVTDYHYLNILPELKKYFKFDDFQDPTGKVLNDESAGYILWCPWNKNPDILPEFIEENLKTGVYKEIFNLHGFYFIRMR